MASKSKKRKGTAVKRKRATSSKQASKQDRTSVAFRRSVFYGVCVFAIYQFILVPLQRGVYSLYIAVGAFGLLLLLAEIVFSSVDEYRAPFATEVPYMRKKFWEKGLIPHVILPVVLYLSGVLFLFFNRIRLLDQVSIVIMTFVFIVLFQNISLTYSRKYSLSNKTKYIFDFASIIIFYFVVDVLVNLTYYYGMSDLIIVLGNGLISSVLLCLMVYMSQQLSKETITYTLITGVAIALITFLVLLTPIFNLAVLSLVITVIFYLGVSFWHHKLEGTFNWDTMFQYLLFAVMAIILLLYL